MQAEIFEDEIVRLESEQGPGIGTAMLAAYGCGWFDSLQKCADIFLKVDKQFVPNQDNVEKYKQIFAHYQVIYGQTKEINKKILEFRN